MLVTVAAAAHLFLGRWFIFQGIAVILDTIRMI